MTMKLVWLMLGICLWGTEALPRALFYPYGVDVEDSSLEAGDDVSSNEIHLNTRIAFYDDLHSSVFVNLNGHLSFETEIPGYNADFQFPLNYKVIAAFLADIDTTLSGDVLFRETQDPAVLERASTDVQTNFPDFTSFMASSLFIATWEDVGRYNQNFEEINTFQIVIASDDADSFAFFMYADDGINWLAGDGKALPTEDPPAQAGFDAGDGRSFTLPASGTEQVKNLAGWSNINVPGVWMFNIGNTYGGNVGEPSQGTEEEVHTVMPDTGRGETCATGARTCHVDASCRDYFDDRTQQGGYCCECNSPNYGNGINCLEPRAPQRVNGRVTGNINGVELAVDLHVYVITIDGRTYTAISRAPMEIGFSMQSLTTIGGVIGWLFSVPVGGAKNGFMLTGGVFNRSVTVKFPGTGDQLKVTQQMLGPSPQLMRMNTKISGTIPRIPEGAQVKIDDFKEEYTRSGPGVIKSYSARTYRVNGVAQRYTWDQEIRYKECPHVASDAPKHLRLSVTRNFVSFVEKEQIVRYAQTTKISPASPITGDECQQAGLTCDSNAVCEPPRSPGGFAQCVCRQGFQGDGLRCRDDDECASGAAQCDVNARCLNTEGSFSCRCNSGFTGDGVYCERDRRCGELVCDSNARCVYNSDEGIEQCECLAGYYGDGINCSPAEASCDVVNNCDENADCAYNRETGRYQCECNDDFSGDGITCTEGTDELGCRNCDSNAQCIYDESRLMYRCQCREQYTGDGTTCTKIEPPTTCDYDRSMCDRDARCLYDDATRRYECRCNPGFRGDGLSCQDEQREPCNRVNNCDPNAECTYIRNTGQYQCACLQGFEGDGYLCSQVDCRRDRDACATNARCVPGQTGYVCVCEPGYNGDGNRRCEALGDQGSYLVYAQGMSIMKVPFEPTPDNPGSMVMHIPGQTAVGVHADCSNRLVYWTDVSGRTINRAALDGSASEQILTDLGSPEGIAIDWVARNLYWTDSGLDRIEVAKVDGTNRKMLIEGDLVNPRAIAIDPRRGTMYWTDWNRKAPKIEMASMDGSDRRVIVEENLGLPNGLTVDYDTEQLCWSDAGTQQIECARSDGSGRRVVYNLASYPFDLTQGNGNLYWTDWDMKAIPNINQRGGSLNEPLSLPVGGNGRIYGVTAVRSRCPSGTNACSYNNGGCRFLCLPRPNGGRTCACPDDIDQEECNRINRL